MTVRVWDDTLLDGLRLVGDDDADKVVAAFFAEVSGRAPADLFRTLVAQEGEIGSPAVAAYLAQKVTRPTWVDPVEVAAGQERFARWNTHVFTALYAASLPTAYACRRGVQVLGDTAQLVTNAKRRLNETAQFHLDVMRSGGLDQGGRGFNDVRHVRLMHAAVRWMIQHDPQAVWDPTWGVPINQEDLLETLLTFTEIVFETFDKTGVTYSDKDAEVYLHTWSLVGFLLGVRPDLLPLSRDDTMTLMPMVRRRQFGESDAGKLLTTALLAQGQSVAPPGLKGLPATTVRFYVGDTTADLLAVPPADWTRVIFGPLAELTRLMSVGPLRLPLLDTLSDRMGLLMLQLAISAERGGQRPAFAIPTELADRWGVSITGVPQGAARRRARRVERERTAD
jgi:hypothetical protein